MRGATRCVLWSALALVLLAAMFGPGCAIKNQKGEEIFALQVKTGKDDPAAEGEQPPTPTPTSEASEPAPTPTPAAPSAATKTSPAPPATTEPEETGANTAKTPWWKRPSVEVKDLDASEKSTDAKSSPTPATTAANKDEDIDEKDLAPDEPAEEPTPEPTPLPPAPEKKEVQVDRHLQPVPHEVWMETYKKQTAPAAKADRRASMGNVQKAIESGYGTTYVTHLENAINVDKSNGYAYYFLARGRFDKADWKGARGFADKSIQMLGDDPKFRSKARVLYAKVLANIGDKEAAAAQAKAAMADDSENTEARILSMKLD